ncbi:ABC transporter permease [Bacillus sp. M6-12]|uniref:ABC transporter permease n=1 Tax=Bacillus sp. M6-12 TaxID=2054166 RepID=UPI000C767E58|nr:ABC transporter permease [Bacillus sp. M6-12]PLS17184.1 ABC transporter permease [Bacillus sp. M6-12]
MILHIFLKEMKDSLRDRKTILLSVLLPILFNVGILLFADSYFMPKGDEKMQIAVNNTADKEVVSWIEQDKRASVIKASDPVAKVNEGSASVAVVIDQDFIKKVENMKTPAVTIHSDSASVDSSSASEYVTRVLSGAREQIVAARLQEMNLNNSAFNPFTVREKSLTGDEDMSLYIVSIFAQLVIVLGVLMGAMPSANDLFAGEKERKTMEALLMTPARRLDIIIGKWLTIAAIGVISGAFSVITFIVTVQYFTKNLVDALNITDHIGFFALSMLVGIIGFALLSSCLFAILSLMANTMKEAQNYISPLYTLAMIPYFLLIGTSVNELTPKHFLIPIFNVYVLIKQLVYGVYDTTSLLLVAGSSAVFIGIFFYIAYLMFTKSRWVLGKS